MAYENARRRMAVRGGLGGCVLLSAVVLSQGRAAGDGGTFHASAEANGVTVTVSAPDFLIAEKLADGGAPKATARVDGLGTSQAMASSPYPGEAATTTPGLVAASTGLPSPPEYPLIASSAHPSAPEAEVDQPGYRLSARSADAASSAEATAGFGQDGSTVGLSSATAEAGRDAGTGAVRASSAAEARSIDVADVFRAGTVTAQARARQTPGGQLVREAQLQVEALTVAGQQVTLGERGLVLAGTDVPLAQRAELQQALSDAGVEVRYLAPVELPDGVISAGLAVTRKQQVPNGPVVITELVFGRAIARAAGSAQDTVLVIAPGADPLTTVPAGEQAPPVIDPPVPISASAVSIPGLPTPGAALPGGSFTGYEPATAAADIPVGGSEPVAAPGPDVPAAAPPLPIGRIAGPGSSSGSYALLVAGAGVAIVLSQLLRRFGVRST